MNGVDKYVTESMLTKEEEDTASGKPIAKARPRQKPTVMLTSISVLVLERKFIDIETQRSHDHECYEESKAITRLLRHDQSVPRGSEQETYSSIDYPVSKQLSTLLRHGSLLREDDGAIELWRKKDYLRYEFENSRHWSDEMWKSTTAKGGGNNKRFQYCTDPSGVVFVYLRALQGHSGRNPIDPELQGNLLIPNNFSEYIYHIGCAINLHFITNSGLIEDKICAKDKRCSSRLWIL